MIMCGVWGVLGTANDYRSRLLSYFSPQPDSVLPEPGFFSSLAYMMEGVVEPRIQRQSRPMMYRFAWRAWQSNPILGVGAGMHGQVSARFAHSGDGDADTEKRPSFNFRTQHSQAVHNDWLQLLEEYGAFGAVLFLPGYVFLMGLFSIFRRVERDDRRSLGYAATGRVVYPWVLGGGLALVFVSIHALSDFSLQIPAVGWLLGGLLAVPVARMLRHEGL